MPAAKSPVPFLRIPTWVYTCPDLGRVDLAVYLALTYYADNETRVCWPGQKTLMAQARIGNPRTLRNSLKRLENTGCVVVKKREGCNSLYFLPLEPPKTRGMTAKEIEFYLDREQVPPNPAKNKA